MYKCKQCQKKHHTLLHFSESFKWPDDNVSSSSSIPKIEAFTSDVVSHIVAKAISPQQILLAIAWVRVYSVHGRFQINHALIDQESASSFMTENLTQSSREFARLSYRHRRNADLRQACSSHNDNSECIGDPCLFHYRVNSEVAHEIRAQSSEFSKPMAPSEGSWFSRSQSSRIGSYRRHHWSWPFRFIDSRRYPQRRRERSDSAKYR